MKQNTVREYMSEDIVKLKPTDTKNRFIQKLKNTGHSGYPVCHNNMLLGYVTSKNILLSTKSKICDVKYEKRPTVSPDCNLNKASRIMSRNIIHELPVTNENDELIGIISNLDIIRSQIERTQIKKVEKIITTYEEIYDIKCEYEKQKVKISELKPTQPRVNRNELKAREHELNNDTAEPIVTINNNIHTIILDGHHRVVAAKNLGIEYIQSYEIETDKEDIKIQENAKKQNVYKIDDIQVEP